MLHKSRGIVLKSIQFSDTSVICHIYTEKFGMNSYIINGVRTAKAKTKMSLLQPLQLLDLVIYHRESKNIQRISELKSAYVFKELPFNIAKSSIGILLTEVLHRSIKEQEANRDLFGFIFDSIVLLDEKKNDFANFHLSFLIRLTKYLGFSPAGQFSAATPFFNLKEGKFCRAIPENEYFLNDSLGRLFSDLIKTKMEDCHSISFNRNLRNSLMESILLYYSLHVDGFSNINSQKILETVWMG